MIPITSTGNPINGSIYVGTVPGAIPIMMHTPNQILPPLTGAPPIKDGVMMGGTVMMVAPTNANSSSVMSGTCASGMVGGQEPWSGGPVGITPSVGGTSIPNAAPAEISPFIWVIGIAVALYFVWPHLFKKAESLV